VETLEGRVVPSQVRFINATGGDWDNPSNWSNGQLPTRFDDAIIDMNVTVTHGGIDEVNSLTQSQGTLTLFGGNLSFDAPSTVLSGATLNLNGGDLGLYGDVNDHSHPGLLTMNGVMNWNLGRIRGGALNFSASGIGNFTGVFGTMELGIPAERATINDAGQITQSSLGPVSNLRMDNALINIASGASYTFSGDAAQISIQVDATQKLITNSGILRRSGGTMTVQIDAPITNNTGGLMDIQTAVTVLTGGITGAGGNINVLSGALLDFSGGGLPTYAGVITGSGGGTILLQNGILTSNGATFNFVNNLFQWQGGAIQGTTLTNLGFMTLSLTGQFLNCTLNNSGTITDADMVNGVWNFNGGTVNNQATGTLDIKNNSRIQAPTQSFVNAIANSGMLKKSVSTGTATIANVLVNNTPAGTIYAQSGTLALAGGGFNSGGRFNADLGAVIDLSYSGGQQFQNMTGTYTGSGLGQVRLVSGRLGVQGLDLTLNFPMGLFNWQGGIFDTTTQNMFNTGYIQISGLTSSFATLVGTLNNSGIILQTGAGLRLNGGTLNNLAQGGYDFRVSTGVTIQSGGTGAFNNFGTVRKSTGSATISNIAAPFNNGVNGLVDVVTGTIILSGGGNSDGGVFNADNAGAILDITGGNTTNQFFSGPYRGTGAGTILLGSGILNAGNGAQLSFNFSAGLFQWQGGTLYTATRRLDNLGFMTISGSTSSTLIGTINNYNAMTLTGASLILNNGTLNNLPGNSQFDIQSDGGINVAGAGLINNAGTFDKSGGTSSGINATVNNPGTVFCSAGVLAFNGSVSQVAGTTLSSGTWQVFNGAILTINSAGNFFTNNATVLLNGPGSNFTNMNSLSNNTGTFSVVNGATFTTTSSLTNTGNVTIGAGSAISVSGSYFQSSPGALSFQIGGPPGSGNFGRLNITGTANLGGALNVSLVNGFFPSVGDAYVIINFTSETSDFTDRNGLQVGNNLAFTEQINPGDIPGNITLVTVQAIVHNLTQEAFVIGTDNQVFGQKFDANGMSASNYFVLQSSPGQLTQVKAIAVGRDVNYSALVFAIGMDDQVWEQKFFPSGDPNGVWFNPQPGRVKTLATGSSASNHPLLFVIGMDDQAYELQFDGFGTPIGGYFAIQKAPGQVTQVKAIAVGQDASYRPLLFAIGLDDQVWRADLNASGTQQGGWFLTRLGRVKALSAGNDGFLRPEVFVIGMDDQVYAGIFDNNDNPFGNYFLTRAGAVKSLTAGHDANNKPEIFVMGLDNQVYAQLFDANGLSVTNYFLTQPGQVKGLSVGYYGSNTPEIFAIGMDDNLYAQLLNANGFSAGNYFITRPGFIRVVRTSP
jgi:hypothetical protein